MIDRILALFNGAESLSRVDIAQGLAVPESVPRERVRLPTSTKRLDAAAPFVVSHARESA